MQHVNAVLQPVQETVKLCKDTELPPGKRMVVAVGGRNIFVTNFQGKLFACDNACHHHGMPLQTGDIEEIGGNLCLVCPWHKYLLSLETGNGFYWALEMAEARDGKPSQQPVKVLKNKGPRQRTHHVYRDGGDVFLSVDTTKGEWASDEYANKVFMNKQEHVTRDVDMSNKNSSTSGNIHASVGGSYSVGGVPRLMVPSPNSPLSSFSSSLSSGPGSEAARVVVASRNSSPLMATSLDIQIKCLAREYEAADKSACTLKFDTVFPQANNALLIRPGMWVTLKIFVPVVSKSASQLSSAGTSGGGGYDDDDAEMSSSGSVAMSHRVVERQYTVVTSGLGSLFAITVRRLTPSPDGYGGASDHLCDPRVDFRKLKILLVNSGGEFHYNAVVPPTLRTAITAARCSQQFCVLWLTAGIGITPLVGFMSAIGNIAWPPDQVRPIRVVHLHSEKTFGALAHAGAIKRYLQTRQYVGFSLHLTATAKEDDGSTIENSVPRDMKELLLGAPASLKFGRFTGTGAISRAIGQFSSSSSPVSSSPTMPEQVMVMLCGPASFMKACAAEAASLGVPAANIRKEAFLDG